MPPMPPERRAYATGRCATVGLAAALLLPALLLAACAGTRGVTVEAPVEVVVAPVGRLADGGARAGTLADAACALELEADRIRKSAFACYLDEQISQGPGVLRYPCSGDGEAHAEFGDQRYLGQMVGGELWLELTTVLDWEDGCQWGTRATITGTLRGAEWERGELSWSYADHVIEGSECSGTCTADTTLTLNELERPRERELTDPDEDDDG